jgi:hypothetical protein
MHVHLKLVLACPPDAVWRALRSPIVFAEVSSPQVQFEPVNGAAFPDEWSEGPHPVRARAVFGTVDVGTQNIDLTFRRVRSRTGGEIRIFEDHGGPLTAPLAVITRWRHRMAVSPGPTANTTLLRDRLEISAGLLTPLVWLAMWAFWQWRARGLVRLAPAFAHRFTTD